MSLAKFAAQAVADPHATAAVAPSSRFLVQAMVEPLPLSEAKVVVEFGPGTGVMTRELLQLVPRDARVLAFEINPRFVEYLRQEIPDPRLEVIAAGAETAAEELSRRGHQQVDAVLSSLGFGLMPESLSRQIVGGLIPLLDRSSGFTQFQYVHRMRWFQGKMEFFSVGHLLEQHFGTVHQRTVWRNLPPANVFDCRL
jgi:phospholipid N-methyltransferase